MFGKKSSISALIFILLFTFGCNSAYLQRKYVGKQFSLNCMNELETSGRHFLKLDHYDIEYDYIVDPQAKEIRLNGTMIYNKTADESKYHSETILLEVKKMQIKVLFADNNGVINGAEVFYIPPGKNIFDPLTIKQTLPFKDEYKNIFLGYFVSWEGV